MKKGYVINKFPNLIPANHDFIYMLGVYGTQREVGFEKKYADLAFDKRGIIHQPVLSTTDGVNENASAFHSLLNDLGWNNWNNGVPLIVDIWAVSGDQQLNFDHVAQYGRYVRDHFSMKPGTKPLLRLNVKTWLDYLSNNRTEAMRLLELFGILLLQPGASKPENLIDYGYPAWFEYEYGLLAYDATRQWVTSPRTQPVVVPEPVVPVPVIPTPETPFVPKRYKISLLGGLIKGTAEEIEN